MFASQCEGAQDDLQGFCARSENWAPGKLGVGSKGSWHEFKYKAGFRVKSSLEQLQAGSVSVSISHAILLLDMLCCLSVAK